MTATDYTKLLEKIVPKVDGEDVTRLRAATIVTVNADGTADITLSGVTVEDVPVLHSTFGLVAGDVVQVLTYRGALLVLGKTEESSAGRVPHAFATFGTPNITNNLSATLTPNAVPVNDGGMWTSGTNFTIPTGQGGLYEIGGFLWFAAQAVGAGARQIRFLVNGAEYVSDTRTAVGINNARSSGGGVARRVMAAGDTIAFSALQTSGVTLALDSASHGWIQRVA